jgi:hypothetical protein
MKDARPQRTDRDLLHLIDEMRRALELPPRRGRADPRDLLRGLSDDELRRLAALVTGDSCAVLG